MDDSHEKALGFPAACPLGLLLPPVTSAGESAAAAVAPAICASEAAANCSRETFSPCSTMRDGSAKGRASQEGSHVFAAAWHRCAASVGLVSLLQAMACASFFLRHARSEKSGTPAG